jgi:hypothetical protein
MTVPNDNTPLSVITDAYFDAGLLQEGETLNGEQVTSGLRKLTDLVNLWQTQGLKLWLNMDLSVPLVSGQGTYTLGPAGTVVMTKPSRVLDAWYMDSSNNRRPLTPLAWADYVRLSQVTQTGTLNSYFVDKQATQLSVFFWPVPDAGAATGGAHLLIQRQVTNPISVTETVDFPIEWRIALRWGLADELCTGQPQAIMDRCQQRANTYRMALEDWDVEDVSTRFTPDMQGRQFSGNFR